MSLSVNCEKSRKRHYRQRIICETCKNEIDSDYKDDHVKKVHQPQLSDFFVSRAKLPKRSMPDMKSSESVSCSPISSTDNTYCHFPHPVDEDISHITSNMTSTSSYVRDIAPCHSSAIASKVQDPKENVTLIDVSNTQFNLQDSTDDFTLLLSLQPLLSTCMIQRKTASLITGQIPSPKLKTREKTFATTSRQATRLTLPSTCKAQEKISIKFSLQSPPQLHAVHQNNLY
ncbi:Hypothetical predicted protein [Paramuricea clavata]|uniref:Uncharacterized protein n=1 Tax=Paramuricea clavata TaxID=317549 RepID=A0A7D9J5D4_PARCT|nr:Hypothetical predicted protein [Paramuricea clavata]